MPFLGRSLLCVAVLLEASACRPAPSTTRCSEPTTATDDPAGDPAAATRTPDPDPGPAPAPAAARAGVRPAEDFPIPSHCEAPLAITEEVARLLTTAAAHATRSNACVDGRGERRAINDLLVCPAAPRDGLRIVEVFYQVVTYPEGDTRGCSDEHPCDWLAPTASEHQIQLQLRPSDKDPKRGMLVDVPTLPGLSDGTPLDEEHDGDCYGTSSPFVPAEIPVGR